MSMGAGLATPGAGVRERVESGFGYFQSWWNRPNSWASPDPAHRLPSTRRSTCTRYFNPCLSSLLA
jgi:hypothetical protein